MIVGAGAAGLWAAGVAAAAGRSVLVLEKTHKAGTKVLASGGTRCNLTTTLGPAQAARLFEAGEGFVLPAFRALPPAEVRRRFHAWGVPTVEEPALEKVFPKSQRAVDVRDALLRFAAGATIRYGAEVQGVRPIDGGWAVTLRTGEVTGRRLILSVGGRSYPRTGTTGDGYGWLEALGLKVETPVPALVPLTSPAGWVTSLTGIAIPQAVARLQDGRERVLARRARPVLFTHHGLSGPGAMDLSVHVARAARLGGGAIGWHVAIDLLPEREADRLRAELEAAARAPGGPRLGRLVEGLPARILEAALAQAGLSDPNPPLSRVDRRARNRLVDALKGLRVPVDGTRGWDEAEVTAGGLSLAEVDERTLEVRRHPGLYVIGELLDLQGPIGGLNFQAAFATAELAARHATR